MSDDAASTRETGRGFSLVMQLEDPAKLGELMRKVKERQPNTRAALASLDYVHYARFLPLWDQGVLLIVTEFDGEAQDYVMDFAAVLDVEFTLILSYMKNHPPLPVSRYPQEFWAYVERNTRPPDPLPPHDTPFSPYPELSVLDIVGAGRRKSLPAQRQAATAPVDLADVQANLLHGYRARQAVHLGLRFGAAERARDFVRALLDGKDVRMTNGARWSDNDRPPYCLNLGFTHSGLQALGLPPELLQRFPQAYREGPLLRAPRLGDAAADAPSNWRIAGVDAAGKPLVVHAMVSLYVRDAGALDAPLAALRALLQAQAIAVAFEQTTAALDDEGTVHFGYRDGIAQPRVAGVPGESKAGRQPLSPPGDFVLGEHYLNSRGASSIGELPVELARNGMYGALRVIEQHVALFEALLIDVERRHGVNRELVAAKLMGRWRDGSPLTRWPDRPAANARHLAAAQLDDFDYVPPDADDADGARCPLGAHVRRLNPRGGMVVGVPWGRRVIRRGMPYGPAFDSRTRDGVERGLFGLFLCADLEQQFEFLQRVWADKDLSAPGLRGTREPFIGSGGGTTPFRFRPREGAPEITIDVPPLTRTVGSLYLLLPGLAALRWIADAGWNANDDETLRRKTGYRDAAADIVAKFVPTDPAFRADPYRFYAAFRAHAPVARIGEPYASWWVFGHRLVREVCERDHEFLKPGKDRDSDAKRPFGIAAQFGDGLFFMDPPRHTEVRALMNSVFGQAIAGIEAFARDEAGRLLDQPLADGKLELVGQFAAKLTFTVFARIMGIPPTDEPVVNGWIRAALAGHDKAASPLVRLGGGTATMALRSYFLALALERGTKRKQGDAPSVIDGMQQRTRTPATADSLSEHEAMATALHFALGGYLSTEFLITTAVYNLLRHPDQWNALVAERALLPRAIQESLRYDAPFQLADRWVPEVCELGGVRLEKGARLAVVYGSANRDEAVFPEPDRFDILRPQHEHENNFGFGHGIHTCIGVSLAYTVTQAALGALLERCPSPRIGDFGPWLADPYFRSLSKLTLLLR